MRLTAGLDSGPVCLQQAERDRARRHLRDARGAPGGPRRRCCSCGRSTARARPPFAEQDEARVTYAEKIGPADRRSTPARPPPSSRARVRALSPHIGAVATLGGGELLGVRDVAAVADEDLGPGDARRAPATPRAPPLRLRRSPMGSSPSRPAARGQAADGRGRLSARARPLATSAASGGGLSAPTPARRAAYGSCAASSSRAPGPTAPSAAAAERHGDLDGPRARPGPAPRLRGGAAARHHRLARSPSSPSRPVERIDAAAARRAAARALRALFADGAADHAAVDQAVELAKGGPTAAAGTAAPGWSTRSCAARDPRGRRAARRARRLRRRRAPRSHTRSRTGSPSSGGTSSGRRSACADGGRRTSRPRRRLQAIVGGRSTRRRPGSRPLAEAARRRRAPRSRHGDASWEAIDGR